MISAIVALITLLSTLAGLWAWWVKRKRAPTPEEQKEDVRQQYEDTFRNVYQLRQQGRHAEADAMLRRLATSATADIVRDAAKSTLSQPKPSGKLLDDLHTQGKSGNNKP